MLKVNDGGFLFVFVMCRKQQWLSWLLLKLLHSMRIRYVCVCVCVHACVHACVCVCEHVREAEI